PSGRKSSSTTGRPRSSGGTGWRRPTRSNGRSGMAEKQRGHASFPGGILRGPFPAAKAFYRSRPVVVDVLDLQGVLLDELAPRLHLLAHQRAEHLVGLEGVVQLHLQERPLGRV